MPCSNKPYPKIDARGIIGYSPIGSFFDQNGKWGGKRAIVAGFTPNDPRSSPIQYLYILVGGYFEVGALPDGQRSRWEVAKLVTEAMENGCNKDGLYDVIQEYLEETI